MHLQNRIPLIFCVVLCLTTGCENQSPQPKRYEVVFPILAECEEIIDKQIKELASQLDITIKYYDYFLTLEFYPNIRKILIASSDTLDSGSISDRLGKIQGTCYPIAHGLINRDNGREWVELGQRIVEHEKAGIHNNYIVVQDKQIKIYYRHEKLFSKEQMDKLDIYYNKDLLPDYDKN